MDNNGRQLVVDSIHQRRNKEAQEISELTKNVDIGNANLREMRAMLNLINDTNVGKNIAKTLYSPQNARTLTITYKKNLKPKKTISINQNLNTLRKAMGNIKFGQQIKNILSERKILKKQLKAQFKEITTLSEQLKAKTRKYQEVIQTPIHQRIRELIIQKNYQIPSNYEFNKFFKHKSQKQEPILKVETIKWIREKTITEKTNRERTNIQLNKNITANSQHYFYVMKLEIDLQNNQRTYYITYCLKCLRHNLNDMLFNRCNPKPFLKNIEPKIIINGKDKQQAKANRIKREQIITILEWYHKLFLTKDKNICFHPECDNPLHLETYIWKELFQSEKNIQRYAFLINMNIEPVFMCCNCFNAKRYDNWEGE